MLCLHPYSIIAAVGICEMASSLIYPHLAAVGPFSLRLNAAKQAFEWALSLFDLPDGRPLAASGSLATAFDVSFVVSFMLILWPGFRPGHRFLFSLYHPPMDKECPTPEKEPTKS
jgi:hypothetical protein